MAPTAFTHIIFDLGGVLYDILPQEEWLDEHLLPLIGLTADLEKLRELSIGLESGRYDTEAFRGLMSSLAGKDINMTQLETAWNARLIGMSEDKMEMLTDLSKRYHLYLLSNTNIIHHASWGDQLDRQFGQGALRSVFSGLYLSYQLGAVKPGREIYRIVQDKMGAPDKGSCLFLDDNPANVKAAYTFGWEAELVEGDLAGLLQSADLY